MRAPRVMKRSKKAFTLLEVVLSIVFFTMMTLLIAATLPMATRSSRQSSDTVQASSLLMHKIDQLQGATYSRLDATELTNLGIVDGAGTLPATNPVGAETGAAEFTLTDRLTTFFVNAAADPRGRIELAPYAPSQKVGAGGAVTYAVVQATVTVTWRDSRSQLRSVSMRTLIPKAKLQ
jgi:type II secretory pathway pseudopilin PulG